MTIFGKRVLMGVITSIFVLAINADNQAEVMEKLQVACKHFKGVYQSEFEKHGNTKHITCNEPLPECVGTEVDGKQNDFIVKRLNELRSFVAKNRSAVDMAEVEWDTELAIIAMAFVSTSCDNGERPIAYHWAYGTSDRVFNLGYLKFTAENAQSPDWPELLTRMRIDEHTALTMDFLKNYQREIAEVFYWNMSRIGCSYAVMRPSSKVFYACFYRERLPEGGYVFEQGHTCGRCPNDDKCRPEFGLCERSDKTQSNAHLGWIATELALKGIEAKYSTTIAR